MAATKKSEGGDVAMDTGEVLVPARNQRRGAVRAQQRKPNSNYVMTPAKRTAFLAMLGETCNIAASARAVKVNESTVHQLRRRNAAFGAAWETALAQGYSKVEMKLLEHVLAGVTEAEVAAAAAKKAGTAAVKRAPFDAKLALSLLNAHVRTVAAERARAHAGAEASLRWGQRRGGPRPSPG